ncbi:MAG: hypothetical protein ABFC96_13310 [Thermoguttaceae bacterium]
MEAHASHFDRLMDLEARHEDLIQRLEDLDRRVERTLAEWQRDREGVSGRSSDRAAAVC